MRILFLITDAVLWGSCITVFHVPIYVVSIVIETGDTFIRVYIRYLLELVRIVLVKLWFWFGFPAANFFVSITFASFGAPTFSRFRFWFQSWTNKCIFFFIFWIFVSFIRILNFGNLLNFWGLLSWADTFFWFGRTCILLHRRTYTLFGRANMFLFGRANMFLFGRACIFMLGRACTRFCRRANRRFFGRAFLWLFCRTNVSLFRWTHLFSSRDCCTRFSCYDWVESLDFGRAYWFRFWTRAFLMLVDLGWTSELQKFFSLGWRHVFQFFKHRRTQFWFWLGRTDRLWLCWADWFWHRRARWFWFGWADWFLFSWTRGMCTARSTWARHVTPTRFVTLWFNRLWRTGVLYTIMIWSFLWFLLLFLILSHQIHNTRKRIQPFQYICEHTKQITLYIEK